MRMAGGLSKDQKRRGKAGQVLFEYMAILAFVILVLFAAKYPVSYQGREHTLLARLSIAFKEYLSDIVAIICLPS